MFELACKNKLDDQVLTHLADLECKARHLKDERFAYAALLNSRDAISPSKPPLELSIAEKAHRDSMIQYYTVTTQSLAKSISHLLDSLWSTTYTNPQQRKELDSIIENKIMQHCK